jgi:heme/copper-type cytochrome/quinol oxidase subunit 4
MDDPITQFVHPHLHRHHHHHGDGSHGHSRRKHMNKIVQRLAITGFLLLVLLTLLYVWTSSGSSETSGFVSPSLPVPIQSANRVKVS